MTLERREYEGDPRYGPTTTVRLIDCPFCGTDLRGKTPPIHIRNCPDAQEGSG